LAEKCLRLIEREAEHARMGRPARIIAKMNALLDVNIIRALYAASQAGVDIELLVRGMCALRPGFAASAIASACAARWAGFSSTAAFFTSRTVTSLKSMSAAPIGCTAICMSAWKSCSR